MTLINLSYKTDYLHTYFKTTAVVPDTGKKNYKAVWLLHGYTGDDSAWIRHTNIEALAKEHDWVIIMPEARNAFYSDSDFIPYYTFFINEYIPKIQSLLPISTNKKDNYIVGSSMGGYGALKIAFKNPDKFSKVAGLSPVVDIEKFRNNPKAPMEKNTFDTIFDSSQKVFDNQLVNIFNRQHPKLKVLTICGDDDYMHEDNIMFKNFLTVHLKDDFTYMAVDGDHSWTTWVGNIENVMNWLEK